MKFKKDDIITKIGKIVADAKKQNEDAQTAAQAAHDKDYTRRLADWESQVDVAQETIVESAAQIKAAKGNREKIAVIVWESRRNIDRLSRSIPPEPKIDRQNVNPINENAIAALEEVGETLKLADGDYFTTTDLKQIGILDILGIGVQQHILYINSHHWFTGRGFRG